MSSRSKSSRSNLSHSKPTPSHAPRTQPGTQFPAGMKSVQSGLATRFVYREDNAIFVAFNGMEHVSRRPGQALVTTAPPVQPHLVPSMLSNSQPYSAFILKAPDVHERHLGRFEFTANEIPVTKSDIDGKHKYTLKKSVKERWMSFEQNLVRIVEHAIASAKPPPPTFVRPTLPFSLHYADSFDSYEELSRHVLEAKKAFEFFVAGAVYIITGMASRGSLMSNSVTPTPSWPIWALNAIKASSDEGFGEWMLHLLFSQAFDFSKPRVGAFIELKSCQFLHQIDFFLQAGIPITFICSLDSSEDGILAALHISKDTKRAIIPSPEERARLASQGSAVQQNPPVAPSRRVGQAAGGGGHRPGGGQQARRWAGRQTPRRASGVQLRAVQAGGYVLTQSTGGSFSRSATGRTSRCTIRGRRNNDTFGLSIRTTLELVRVSSPVCRFTSGSI